MSTISPQTALIYVMVIVSASDSDMTDSEFERMGQLVQRLPAFDDFDSSRVLSDAQTCAEILQEGDGFEAVLGLVKEAIPDTHRDLMYAVACELAAADRRLTQEEMRILQILRHRLGIDRLTAAAIERGVVARRKTFDD